MLSALNISPKGINNISWGFFHHLSYSFARLTPQVKGTTSSIVSLKGKNIPGFVFKINNVYTFTWDFIHIYMGENMPQSFSKLLVHIIFSTKDRYKYLCEKELRSEVHKYLGGICNALESQVVSVGGAEDHVHIFCMLSKNVALTKLIMEIKRESSRWIKTKSPTLSNFSWQRGYAAYTISQSHCEPLVQYIAAQEEHHKKKTFQEEFRAFLVKYNVKFDERYMWD